MRGNKIRKLVLPDEAQNVDPLHCSFVLVLVIVIGTPVEYEYDYEYDYENAKL